MPEPQGAPKKTVMLKFECPADFAFTSYAIIAISDTGQQYSTYMQPMHPVACLEFVKGLVACVLPPVQQKLAQEQSRIMVPKTLPPGLSH